MSEGTGTTDNSIGWVILMAFMALCGYFIWQNFEMQIKDVVRWLRYGELWVLSWVVPDEYTIEWGGVEIEFQALFELARDEPASALVGDDNKVYGAIVNATMQFIRIPTMVILGLMAFWTMMWGPNTHLRRKMDVNGLIHAQSGNFPIIHPFDKFDPSTLPCRAPGTPVPAELPLFSEALGPEEWIAYNEIPAKEGKLNEDVLYRAFARQLGKPWRGYARLDKHKQILLAAFCLKAVRKRGDADDMLGQLSICWSDNNTLKIPPKLHRQALKVLKNRKISGEVLQKCNQHAYETTAMLRGLQTARENGGVLAPAQFVWLRGFDRRLWYPMNNLGRQSYHMESLGAMSHYRSEKLTSRPVPRPKVEKAVDSIVTYMASARARPIPALDYSKSKKKRGVKKVRGSA